MSVFEPTRGIYNDASHNFGGYATQADAQSEVELQRAACEQYARLRDIAAQQATNAQYTRMLHSLSSVPEPKLQRAQRIAAEVRARYPGMQVRRLAAPME